MSQTELTIAGVGGQGSILAGVILGSAAVTYDGKFAVQTQAYSSELRGGFAAAWVIVSDDPIEFPRVTRPDILIAQAQDSISRYYDTMKKDGILIIDSDMVQKIPPKVRNTFMIPATSIARYKMKA
ncbi:MAG: 2-oxoacid:acceptor oxidoreductase family protein, partial [Methanomassiliicoccales archaeon]